MSGLFVGFTSPPPPPKKKLPRGEVGGAFQHASGRPMAGQAEVERVNDVVEEALRYIQRAEQLKRGIKEMREEMRETNKN